MGQVHEDRAGRERSGNGQSPRRFASPEVQIPYCCDPSTACSPKTQLSHNIAVQTQDFPSCTTKKRGVPVPLAWSGDRKDSGGGEARRETEWDRISVPDSHRWFPETGGNGTLRILTELPGGSQPFAVCRDRSGRPVCVTAFPLCAVRPCRPDRGCDCRSRNRAAAGRGNDSVGYWQHQILPGKVGAVERVVPGWWIEGRAG